MLLVIERTGERQPVAQSCLPQYAPPGPSWKSASVRRVGLACPVKVGQWRPRPSARDTQSVPTLVYGHPGDGCLSPTPFASEIFFFFFNPIRRRNSTFSCVTCAGLWFGWGAKLFLVVWGQFDLWLTSGSEACTMADRRGRERAKDHLLESIPGPFSHQPNGARSGELPHRRTAANGGASFSWNKNILIKKWNKRIIANLRIIENWTP